MREAQLKALGLTAEQTAEILTLSKTERTRLIEKLRQTREELQHLREEKDGALGALTAQFESEKQTLSDTHAAALSALRRQTAAERAAEKLRFTSESARAAYLAGAMDALAENADGEIEGVEAYTEAFLARDPSAVEADGAPQPRIVSGGGRKTGGMTAEDLAALPYAERLRLKKRAPALYRSLTKGDQTDDLPF